MDRCPKCGRKEEVEVLDERDTILICHNCGTYRREYIHEEEGDMFHKKQDYEVARLNKSLGPFLQQMVEEFRNRGEYIYNEPGSGDVSYIINGKLFEFNEYPQWFHGFFIDQRPVSLKEMLGELRGGDDEKGNGNNSNDLEFVDPSVFIG